jgi:hypothetical protein
VNTSICLSLDFFQRIFIKRHWRYEYADSVSPNCLIGLQKFSQHNRMSSFIFSTDFFKDYT